MSLSDKIKELLFDSRLIERNLKLGKIDQNSLKKYLNSLDDLSNDYELLDVEELFNELKEEENNELSIVDSSKE